ncbi:Cyd operon protein YbgE [Pseudomonas sp. LTJR-52]|uniref:cyd operon YbgE family protein n=1 Tax=Pseudomonas sp. LTJR-52 TaxID=2479392 RepID=UPI000EFC486A|nr:cyd operon YbgE family protein [Pseudomonas sp. LTJR-52]AYN95303.1 Cyd operon protein YbgE [Pseudomonas sp. LTJR-52]
MITHARPVLLRGGFRVLSLLLASPLCLLLLIYPTAFLNAEGHYSHSMLMLVMWGVAGGFVHGVGFDPRAKVWKWAFGPLLAWMLMALGYALLIQARMG